MAGPAIVGVARILDGAVDGLWEQHDAGDELLVLSAGRVTIVLRPANGEQETHDLGPGDVLLVPKGAAHCFKLRTPEIQLLFVTPRDGNSGWSDKGDVVKRHK